MLKQLLALCVIYHVSCTAEASRWSPFGIVEGIKDCGSSGKLGDVAVTDCTATPCRFVPNAAYDVSIRFTASVTSSTLRLQIHEASSGFLMLQYPIDGQIEAGIEYEMKFQLPINPEWSGAEFDIIFYILDFEGTIIEVCAQAAIIIA